MHWWKGSRINRIIEELNGEKIDVIAYQSDASEFIKNALSPAKDVSVFVTDEKKKEAMVIVDENNLSLAIGKRGINIKLASKLTKYHLDIKTKEDAKKMGINLI